MNKTIKVKTLLVLGVLVWFGYIGMYPTIKKTMENVVKTTPQTTTLSKNEPEVVVIPSRVKMKPILHQVKSGQTIFSIARSYGTKKIYTRKDEAWVKKKHVSVNTGEWLAMRPKPYLAIASWYGPVFHGRRMANGEVYNQYNPHIVAHKTLPLGTKVRITNPENGRELIATVKDRGPFIKGRSYDLSYGGAKYLGFSDSGLAKLKFEILSTSYQKSS